MFVARYTWIKSQQMNHRIQYIQNICTHIQMYVYVWYSSTQTWYSFLITHVCWLILFESRTIDCVFFASNSCGVTNLTCDWWKLSLHTSLLTSSAKEIQEQDSIVGTQDFSIKDFLHIDININKRLQNGGVAWVTSFGALSRYMHYIANWLS